MHSCSVAKSFPTLCEPIACQAPLSMGFSRQEYWNCHLKMAKPHSNYNRKIFLKANDKSSKKKHVFDHHIHLLSHCHMNSSVHYNLLQSGWNYFKVISSLSNSIYTSQLPHNFIFCAIDTVGCSLLIKTFFFLDFCGSILVIFLPTIVSITLS